MAKKLSLERHCPKKKNAERYCYQYRPAQSWITSVF